MIALRTLPALLLAALALLAPARAAAPDKLPAFEAPMIEPDVPNFGERILSFVSDIRVDRDGTLHVAETIRIRAEGNQFRHGLLRDFPTRYERDGRTVRVGFEVDAVERNGRPEPWTTEGIDNGERIRIGSAEIFLPQGEHSYTIRYRTTRQLGFFADYDELYWNVTGNGWAFPIDRAEARVRLPQAVRLGDRAVYTGPQGSTARDAEVVEENPGEIRFRTTRPLGEYEGLTIAVAWPKGVVEAPPPPSASALWMQRNGPWIAALLALIGLGAFYYYAWRRAGRGPVPGTVVPLFAPPEAMSAAAIRYVRRMGYDNRTFAAAIVDGGVQGKLRLEEGQGGWLSKGKTTIHKTGDPGDMPAPERNMLQSLFGGRSHVQMDKSEHAAFRAAQSALEKGLSDAYKGKLFLTNKGWAWVGLVLLLAAMLFAGTIAVAVDPYVEPGAAAVPAIGFLLLIGSVWAGKGSAFAVTGGSKWLAALSILLAIGGGLFVAMALALIVDTGEAAAILAMLAPLLALPLAVSAFWWMAAPTREGRALMDEIAGFERYLSITEEERLDTLHPPEKTPELFERFLPHAIALGVENRWASRFSSVLAAAAADPNRRDRDGVGWYSGSHSPWSNPGRFAAAMGGALASTAAAASTAPGSSSGSGGGGSSGGGGGGGGGGGW